MQISIPIKNALNSRTKIFQHSLSGLLSGTWSWIYAFSRGASAGYCSPSVHDKVAACVLSMSTRWNLQMHTYLWLVTMSPSPSRPSSRSTSHT